MMVGTAVGVALLVLGLGTRTGADAPRREVASNGTDCAGSLWAVNNSEQTITIIDQATNTIMHTESIATGYPREVTFSADGRVGAIHTWTWSHDIVHILDGATGVETSQFEIGQTDDVSSVAISADGTKVFVLRAGNVDALETWSIASGTRIAGPVTGIIIYPMGLQVSATDLFFMGNSGFGSVIDRFDAAALVYIGRVTPAGATVAHRGYALTRDGSTLWWLDSNTGHLSRFDIATSTSTDVAALTTNTYSSVLVSPDGSTVAIAERGWGDNDVVFFDTATSTVTGSVTVTGADNLRPGGFDATGTKLYLVNFDYANTRMIEIDAVARTVVTSFMSGGETISATPCPVADLPPAPTTSTTATDPVVPKVTG